MKDETAGSTIEGFLWLKPKMYSFVVDDNSEHKTAKSVNRNLAEKITHNEYKDILLNNKWIGNSVNRIQSRNHRIGTYEINKISLSRFHDKIYI